MPDEAYIFERLVPGHYPLLKQLFFNCFKLRESIEQITQRFNTKSLGEEVIGFIALDEKTKLPAAYYGVFPMKAVVNNEIIQIAQSGDTMTDPAHRKKGLFIRLAELTYEECRKKNIQLLIGQPNQYSYHGLVKKLQWTHLDDIVRWDLKQKIITLPLNKITSEFSFLKKIYHLYAKRVLRKFQVPVPLAFQNSFPASRGKILRDENYITYKKSSEKYFIKINQVNLWVRLTDIFWIGDFDKFELIDAETIHKLKKLAWWLGYNTISFNLNRSVVLPAALSMFRENSSQASCFLYFNHKFINMNFILTGADSDTW